jgi:putative ABC transport system permease protein
VILIALGVLILGQYISELKETGIRRLAGEGKYSIAFQKCSKDVIFMIVITVFLLITLFTVLNLMKIYSRQAFEIVVIPILLWSLIVVVLDIALSNLYYHLLQRQPLVPSIKGKAPLKMIVIAVLLTQFLSLFALLTSAWKLEQSYRILADYEKAKSVWMEYPGYSQMQALFLGEGVLEDELQEFKNNLLQIKGILYRKMNFELTDAQLENRDSYLPNSWMIVNAIWVNAEFLKLNQIELSEHDWKTIEQLGIYDRYILLPESLNDEDGKIKKTWIEIEKTAAEAYRSEENNFSQEITVNTSFYKDTRPVFTFAVFTPYTQSAQKYLYSPIIIVENNNLRYEDPTTVLVPDVEEAEKLIREHKLTAAFGSFTNGLYSINEKIGDTKISQAILAAGAVCSLICSFMLIFLLNLIYFYQGRRQFFIERLAGKSLLEIHRKYLLITSAGCILISLAAVILGAGWKTGVIPLIYCLVLYLLFWLQMKKEQEANILYLKGE